MVNITNPIVAIMLFALGMGIIPLNDVFIKLMSDRLSVFEILTVRSMFSIAMLLLIPATIRSIIPLTFKSWLFLSIRGLCLAGAMLLFFIPLASLSIAEVTAIFFTAPLFISLLSVPLLGERLGLYRILAVIIGIIGVLLIVQPGGERFQMAYLMPIGASLSYAAYQIITRYLREDADLFAMVTVQNLVYLFVGLVGIIFTTFFVSDAERDPVLDFILRPWTMPNSTELIYMLVGGIIVLYLSFVSSNVYRNVEATLVAPFEYTALPTSIVWGIIVWGDWPDMYAWAGILLILSGGILMIYRENLRQTPIASAAPMRAAATNAAAPMIDEGKYKSLPFNF